MAEREPEVELHPQSDTRTQSGFGPAQSPSPAVDEIRHRVMLAEGGRVQVHADLHVVPCHDAHCSLVLILEDLPLQGRTQEQHEVIWQDREFTESPSSHLGFHDAANSPHKGGAPRSPADECVVFPKFPMYRSPWIPIWGPSPTVPTTEDARGGVGHRTGERKYQVIIPSLVTFLWDVYLHLPPTNFEEAS